MAAIGAAVETTIEHADPDLAAVIDAWPTLPEALKAGIVAMIQAAIRYQSDTQTVRPYRAVAHGGASRFEGVRFRSGTAWFRVFFSRTLQGVALKYFTAIEAENGRNTANS